MCYTCTCRGYESFKMRSSKPAHASPECARSVSKCDYKACHLRACRNVMAQLTMHSLLNHTHPAVLVSHRRCMPFKAASPNRARHIRLTCQAAGQSSNMPETSCTQSRRSLLLAGATAAMLLCMLYSRQHVTPLMYFLLHLVASLVKRRNA